MRASTNGSDGGGDNSREPPKGLQGAVTTAPVAPPTTAQPITMLNCCISPDFVGICEAPDDAVMARYVLQLGGLGFARTKTLVL